MSWWNKLTRLINTSGRYTPPPNQIPLPAPIFSPSEMSDLVDKNELLTNQFEELQQLAIKVRKAGKFKKIDKPLLEKFDKMAGVDFSVIEDRISTCEKENNAKKRKSSSS